MLFPSWRLPSPSFTPVTQGATLRPPCPFSLSPGQKRAELRPEPNGHSLRLPWDGESRRQGRSPLPRAESPAPLGVPVAPEQSRGVACGAGGAGPDRTGGVGRRPVMTGLNLGGGAQGHGFCSGGAPSRGAHPGPAQVPRAPRGSHLTRTQLWPQPLPLTREVRGPQQTRSREGGTRSTRAPRARPLPSYLPSPGGSSTAGGPVLGGFKSCSDITPHQGRGLPAACRRNRLLS